MTVTEIPYVTRVLVPQKRADVLHRERLVDFLHEQVECRLILISAPAGYGKTTLLVDYAHSTPGAVCWYSLSEADKDPKVFLEYLIGSIRHRFPNFGERTLSLLGQSTDLGKDLSSIIGILVNEIHDSILDYFFIVLDDYHFVDDSPQINEALDLLLSYLPSNCHILLASRTLPKITLSRLAAQRMVAGLGTSDLRFTVPEIKNFLRTSFKVLLPDSLAQELAESSEGWITSIVLSTYGLGQGMLETILRARNSGGPVFDFLASEVFDQQPEDLQRFLLESSCLRQFNPERCNEVLGISDGRDQVKALEERNLFASRIEGSNWYQYHKLFADYLQSRLKEENPKRYVEVHLRAGKVCQQQGETEEAVQHYVHGGNFDKVVAIIEANGEALLGDGKLQTVQRWLNLLPPALREANPALMAFEGRILSQLGELDKALAAFDRAVREFERRGDNRGLAMALARRSTVCRWMGDRQEAFANCRRVLQIAGGLAEIEAEARKEIGILRGMDGKFEEGIPELQRALAIYERLGSIPQMAEINHSLGTSHYFQGDLTAAYRYYRTSRELWEKTGNLGAAAEILNSLGMTSYRQGEYEEALDTLREALDKVRKSGYLRIEAHILGSVGTVCRDKDDFVGALEAYENGLDLARRVNEVPLITFLLNEIGGIYRLRGELARAERLIRQALSQAQQYGGEKEIALGDLYLGLLAFDRDNFRQAVAHLNRACKGLQAIGAQIELTRAHYYLANIYLSHGRREQAEKQLQAIDQIISALGGEANLLAEVRRMPRPAEFAVAKGIGASWFPQLRSRAESMQRLASPAVAAPDATREVTGDSLPKVRAYALGQDKALCGEREVSSGDWSTQVAKELFFYLLSQPRGTRREEILAALWPDLPTARALSSFHVALYRVRRATFYELPVYQGPRYLLNPGVDVWYDVEEFESCVNKALNCGANSDEAIPYWEKAVSFYQGPFLARFYNEWCESKRRGLEERYLQALGALARYRFKQEDYQACISYYEKILATDPYTEETHRQLIKAYALTGDRAAAIRHYNRLVQILNDELGTEPDPETISIYNSLLKDSTGPKPDNNKGKDQRSGGRGT